MTSDAIGIRRLRRRTPREGRRGRPRDGACDAAPNGPSWVYSRRPSSRSSPRGTGGTVVRWWTRRRPSRRLGRTPARAARRTSPWWRGVASLEMTAATPRSSPPMKVAAGGPGEEVMAAPRWHSGMPASYLPETRPASRRRRRAAELDNLELAILERDDEAGVLGLRRRRRGLVRGAARVGLDEETVEETQGVVGVALGGAVGGGIAKRAGGGATSERTRCRCSTRATRTWERRPERRRTREPVTARTASASMRRWDAWKEKGGGGRQSRGRVKSPDVPDTRGTRGPSRVE